MRFVLVLAVLSIALAASGCTATFPGTKPPVVSQVSPVFDSTHKVMVFAAHHDDEAIGAATVMSRAVKNGGDVTLVMTTDGAPKEFGHGDFEAEVRKEETKKAMSLIGVSEENILFLGYDDLGFIFEIDVEEEIDRITKLIQEKQPTQIYIQAYEGGHIDHDATHYLVTEAIKRSGLDPKVYEFPEYNTFSWGGPIPDESDTIDNEEYPVMVLDLSEEEKRLKKDVIKQYVSQHPFKSNLVSKDVKKGVSIVYLGVSVNGEDKDVAELKSGDEHYLHLGNIIPFSGMSLSVFGDYFFTDAPGTYPVSNRGNIDFLMQESDFFLPHFYECEDIPTEEWGYVMKKDKLVECINSHGIYYESCYGEPVEEVDGIKYCDVYGNKDHATRHSQQIDEAIDYYTGMYPEGMPQEVVDKLRYGSYYKKVSADDPLFGGTIVTKVGSEIKMLIEVGNTLDIPMNNVVLQIVSDGIYGSFPSISEHIKIPTIQPKTITVETINFTIPLLTEKHIYSLKIAVIDENTGDRIFDDVIFFSFDVKKEDYDATIISIEKREWSKYGRYPDLKGLDIGVRNIGTNDIIGQYTIEVINDELDIDITYPHDIEECEVLGSYCKPLRYYDREMNPIDYEANTIESGSGDTVPIPLPIYKMFLEDDPGKMEAEYDFDVVLAVNEDEIERKKVKIVTNEDGTFDVYDYKNYREFDMLVSDPERKKDISMENCDEDDYLICLFYWPDMIRELPDYDYTEPPHERPPILLYETPNEKFNIYLKFEDFRDVITIG